MFCEHGQQQRDGQLRAQALQQLQEAGTTVGKARAGGGSPGDPSLVPGHSPKQLCPLPGLYQVFGHQSSPDLGTYLRGRGEDTGWQRSRLS